MHNLTPHIIRFAWIIEEKGTLWSSYLDLIIKPSGVTFDIIPLTDSFLFKIGRIEGEDSEFALIYNPIQNDQTELSYAKNLNGFDIKINSNYSFTSKIPD